MKCELIDTHAHVNFNAYKNDSNEVIKRSLAENIHIINVGSQYSTSKRAVEIAEGYEKGVYAAIGLHPIHLETGLVKMKEDNKEIEFETSGEEFNYDKYKELTKSLKVVALGEVGLDYHWNLNKEKQRTVLCQQLDLAENCSLPVVLHCRNAHDDMIELLTSRKDLRGVVHCFTGTWEQAQKYMAMGFYLGLNGIIFKMNLDEVIAKAPLDRILLETDCPYLTPQPMEGRNEPAYVKYVAKKIAKIKNLSYDAVKETTTKNAKQLFQIQS